MSPPRFALRLFRLALLLSVLVLTACGYKSPPLPLQKPLPVAPPELQARQLGQSMLIAWTVPGRNQNDTPLTNLAGFNLYRMRYDPQDACPDCIDRSTLLQRIDLDYPVNAQLLDQRVYLFDRDIRPGQGYAYRVAARTDRGYEGAFARVRQPAQEVVDPPAGLTATGLDRLVRVEWQGAQPPPDSILLGYRLYRAEGDGPFLAAAVAETSPTATSYDDFAVENGRSYRYRVRSVIERHGITLESAASAPASAVPRTGR